MIFWELFSTFFRVGLFTFGGGYAMLPMIEQEVEAHQWMSLSELVDFIAVSESTPGPFAVNVSTYIGSRMAGFPGAVCATFGVVLPSFLVILAVANAYKRLKDNRIVNGMLGGLRPAVVGLIGAALISVAGTVFFPDGRSVSAIRTGAFAMSAVVFLAAVLISHRKKVSPILMIVAAAAVGVICGYAGLLA